MEHISAGSHEAFEDEVRITAGYGDGVRVEIEAYPIARLSVGRVVGDIDRVGIINQGLHTPSAHQGCRSTHIEITCIIGVG